MEMKKKLAEQRLGDITLVVERMSTEAFAEAYGMPQERAARLRAEAGPTLLAIWAEEADGSRRLLRTLPDKWGLAELAVDLWSAGVADACSALKATA